MPLDELIDCQQFSLDKTEKEKALFAAVKPLHEHHYANSKEYKRVCDAVFPHHGAMTQLSDVPFLPVSIFKTHALKSVSDENVFKVLTSSGTTGQTPSRIYLDKTTAQLQTKALSKIITHVIGNKRLPMLIIDSKSVLSNREMFSARGAGILGLSVFGSNHCYVLNDQLQLEAEMLREFLQKYNGQPILIFGFTFMVWLYLYNMVKDGEFDLSNAFLIHSGGWKKLTEINIDNNTFKSLLNKRFGLKPDHCINFYGMVEQVGSVYIENHSGYLHCPNFSDVIIRDPYDFSVLPHGKEGLIQVVSALPYSYPGHSILTEDLGVIVDEDNASLSWKGKYFKILGRAKKAELRGCSDTFTNKNQHVA